MSLAVSTVSSFLDGSTNHSLAYSSEVEQVNPNMSALLNRVRRITGLHYRFWTEDGRKDPGLPVIDLLCPANLLNRSKLHFDLDLFREVVATEFEFQPHLNPVNPEAPIKQINSWMVTRYFEYCVFPIIFDKALGKTIEKAKSTSKEIQQEIEKRNELAAKVLGPSVLKLNESLKVHNDELLECSRLNEIVNNSVLDSLAVQ